jgi:hypothetical protein
VRRRGGGSERRRWREMERGGGKRWRGEMERGGEGRWNLQALRYISR